MKKTLLLVTLCASLFATKAAAQTEPYTLTVFDEAVYYGMYDGLVSTPIPEGAIRNSNSSYGMKLTEEQIASIGNKLTINVKAEALCDDYDRIGNVNLAFVPKGASAYTYADVERIEIARFITPFMNNITRTTTSFVPYSFEADNITKILHDTSISADYDFWLELEIYGHQGGPNADQGGAQWDFLASGLCADRNDVYKGSLELVSETDSSIIQGDDHYFKKLCYKYEMRDYTLEGTEEIGETIKSYSFTLENDVPNAKFVVVMSNHGANSNGEEYKNRIHYVSLDGTRIYNYTPGMNCEPFRQYNTMGNYVYGTSAKPESYWLGRAWCPGGHINTRVVELGDLTAGEHTFTMEVPQATFAADQGYFPMSVYVQAYEQTLGTDKFVKNTFSVHPNPVNDIATISSNGQEIKSVAVINTLGQTVYTGTSDKIDMSSLQSGIYIVNVVFANNAVATNKIVKK